PRRYGLAALDRADARRHPRRHGLDRRRPQCRHPRRAHPGHLRHCARRSCGGVRPGARGPGRAEESAAEGLPVTLAAPRPSEREARPLIESRPLRYPDTQDADGMGRRAWWLVVMNVLVPGSAQVLAGNRRLGRFGLGATLLGWFLLVVAAGLALFAQAVLVWFATGPLSWFVLTLAQIVLLGYVVLWVILTIDTVRLVRLVKVPTITRWAAPIASVLVLALVSSGAVYASNAVASGRGAISAIFGNSGPSLPRSEEHTS